MYPIKRSLLVFASLSLLAVGAFSQVPKRRDGKPDNSEYRTMVERVKKGDATVDFVKFRAAYMGWINDECNVSEAPHRDDIAKAFEAKNFAKAVELAIPVLEYEYGNRGLHLAVANAYTNIGNAEKAKFHNEIAAKLLKALLDSGDGKSAKTAYKVHSIREEYIVMRELGYQVTSQALAHDPDLGSFDILSGKKADGAVASLYFDINDWWIGSTASKPCKK